MRAASTPAPSAGSTPPRRSSRPPARAPWRASSRRRVRRRPGWSWPRSSPRPWRPSRSATALASSRVIRSSEPVNTIVWPASGWPAAIASIGSIVTSLMSASSAASLRGSAKKSAIASATTGPIPPIAGQFFRRVLGPRSGAQGFPVAEMARQAPRVGLADMADAKRIEEAVERNRPARVDGVEQIAGRSLAETFPFAQRRTALPVARLQRENVGRRADQALGKKELDQLLAQALDVEGVARHEMLEPLDRLRRTDERAGAAAHHVRFARLLVDLAQSRRAADRADRRGNS